MTFSWLLSIICHTLCPFIPHPPFLSYSLSAKREREIEGRKRWWWGGLPVLSGPTSLSSCHWERVNTKPPLLTSTLKHWDAGRQGDSLTAASCQRHKVHFCLSVIVQNQTLPPSSASSPPARWYLRPSVWDTGNVLITTRVSVFVLMSLETKKLYFKVSLLVFASTCHLNASKWNLWSWWM